MVLSPGREMKTRLSQCSPVWKTGTILLDPVDRVCLSPGLNVVRSGRPEQSAPPTQHLRSGNSLNVVRSGRPEQFVAFLTSLRDNIGSQCSPVWKTGTITRTSVLVIQAILSQCSPVWKTGTMGMSWGIKNPVIHVSM